MGGLKKLVPGRSAGRGMQKFFGGMPARHNLDMNPVAEDRLSCIGILNEDAHINGACE
ncbi:MAG: hypothetical protein ACREHD_03400 [Pirellulales bacterium]